MKRNWNRGLPTDCNSTAECIYIRMHSIAKIFFEDTYSTHLDWISEEAEGCRFRIAQYLPTLQVSPGNVWRSCEVCSISQHVLQQLAHHSSNFTPHYHHSTPRSSTTGAENTIHHHWSVICSFQRSFWVCCDVHNVVYSVKVQWKIVLCFFLPSSWSISTFATAAILTQQCQSLIDFIHLSLLILPICVTFRVKTPGLAVLSCILNTLA